MNRYAIVRGNARGGARKSGGALKNGGALRNIAREVSSPGRETNDSGSAASGIVHAKRHRPGWGGAVSLWCGIPLLSDWNSVL